MIDANTLAIPGAAPAASTTPTAPAIPAREIILGCE